MVLHNKTTEIKTKDKITNTFYKRVVEKFHIHSQYKGIKVYMFKL